MSEQRPKAAAFFVILLSVMVGGISVLQEQSGNGVEQNSARRENAPPINAMNTTWVIISTALVMIMTPAVALYYGGMVRDEQVLNRMVRTFVNLGLVGFQWLFIGYSLSFAPSNPYAFNLVGDFSFVAMTGVGSSPAGSPAESYGIPHMVFVCFQLMFSSITTTILSGSVANLMSFHAFCLFILAWTTLVYDPICHAIWGGGLLSWHVDFAGGLVIHVSSGASACAAATFLYRLSRFTESDEGGAGGSSFTNKSLARNSYRMRRVSGMNRLSGEGDKRSSGGGVLPTPQSEFLEDPTPSLRELLHYLTEPGYNKDGEMVWDRALGGGTIAHNRTFVVLGAVLLWFGWFGFNGGSALGPNEVAAAALLNTNIAAGVAMITWMFCEAMCGGNPSAVGAATGTICGLVGITPCAGYIPTLAAVPVGVMSAGCAFGFVWLDKHSTWFTWLSNPLDVIASHGISGFVGSLMNGVFAFKPVNEDEVKLVQNGLAFGGGLTLFLDSCVASLVVVIYSAIMTIIICIMLTQVLGVDGILSAGLLFHEDGSLAAPEEKTVEPTKATLAPKRPAHRGSTWVGGGSSAGPGKGWEALRKAAGQQRRRRMSIGN